MNFCTCSAHWASAVRSSSSYYYYYYYYFSSVKTLERRYREFYKQWRFIINNTFGQKWDTALYTFWCIYKQVSSLGRPLSKSASTYGISRSRCAREMQIVSYSRESHLNQITNASLFSQSSSQRARTQKLEKSTKKWSISQKL